MGKINKRLGKKIRLLRKDESLSVFAKKLGISKSSLQRIEMGEQNLTLESLEVIAERLKISISELFEE